MNRVLSKLLLLALLLCPAAAQDWGESSWTLDETPQPLSPVQSQPLVSIPEPLTHLFPFLQSLLQEIALGRQRGDAQSLIQAVSQLSRILSLGGVDADAVNTDRLLSEATDIAWEQRDPIALQRSLDLWSDPIRAGRSQGKINETEERLEEVEQERSEMLNRKRCQLVFHNRTKSAVQVFVNRKPVATLDPGKRQVVADLLAGRQHLSARHSSLQWGPRKVYVGPGEVFNWRLFD